VLPTEQQHDHVRKGLEEFLAKCDNENIDPEIVAQTLLSFAVTTAWRFSDDEDLASLLESIAEAIRDGTFTRDDA
jgi:hypothetical protein